VKEYETLLCTEEALMRLSTNAALFILLLHS
jgi:hypothetical protein